MDFDAHGAALPDPRALLDGLPDPYLLIDDDWRLRHLNRAGWRRMLLRGLTPELALGRVLWESCPDLMESPLYSHLESVRTSRAPAEWEWRAELDGHWFLVQASPAAAGLSVLFRDISELRELRESTRRWQHRFESLLHGSPVGCCISRAQDGVVMEVNQRFLEVCGLSDSDVRGKHLDQLPFEIVPRVEEGVQSSAPAEAEVQRVGVERCRLRLPSGAHRAVACFQTRLDFDGGPGVLTSIEDLTWCEEVEAQLTLLNAQLERRVHERTAALEAANRELETFSYSVSHDLRTPLRSIRGFTEAVVRDYAAEMPGQALVFLERVQAAGEKMSLLIDDLLGLSRVVRAPINRAQVHLSSLVWQCAVDLQSENEGRLVQFTIEEDVFVKADERLLTLAVDNLVRNAWKYTRNRVLAQIQFGVEHRGRVPVYFVRDNGAGFSMEYAHRLFQPFQRLHSEAEFEGTGIGLAIVARVIRRHGGAVWATGQVGGGATFYFTLEADDQREDIATTAGSPGQAPAADPPPATAPRPVAPRRPSHRRGARSLV